MKVLKLIKSLGYSNGWIKPKSTPKFRPYPEGYFMQPSPLSKDYVKPTRLQKIAKWFSNLF